jgi:predicted DNA binding CopG/RHH family protein
MKHQNNTQQVVPLDEEEKELIDLYEKNETVPVTGEERTRVLALLNEATENFLTKNKKINIRVSNGDVHNLKKKADELGMPYQTLISSILHQYATGRIKASF